MYNRNRSSRLCYTHHWRFRKKGTKSCSLKKFQNQTKTSNVISLIDSVENIKWLAWLRFQASVPSNSATILSDLKTEQMCSSWLIAMQRKNTVYLPEGSSGFGSSLSGSSASLGSTFTLSKRIKLGSSFNFGLLKSNYKSLSGALRLNFATLSLQKVPLKNFVTTAIQKDLACFAIVLILCMFSKREKVIITILLH